MVASKLITADEFVAMGKSESHELIAGELHEVSPTFWEPSVVTMYLGAAIVNFVEPLWRAGRDPARG